MESPKSTKSTKSTRSSPIKVDIRSGSRQCPYKLAIIGGGPSGCSIIVRAIRIGLIGELCDFTYPSDEDSLIKSPLSAGVCLIDGDTVDRFGGGRLQDYLINSNTFINKFVTNVVEEKLDNLPPEKVNGTVLEALKNSPIAAELLKVGNKTGSLQKVGYFLNEVGQVVLSTIHRYPNSSYCYNQTKVLSMSKVADENGNHLMWKLLLVPAIDPQSPPFEIFAKHVCLATGGHQDPPVFSNSLKSKVMTSDDVCCAEGIAELRKRLMRNPGAVSGSPKVVIIGGSHSAFSAAWMCLNKLDEEKKSLSISASAGTIIDPTTSITPVAPATSTPTTSTPIATTPTTATANLRFGPSGICILHRSSIKVFYATKAEADRDDYFDSSTCINKVTGQINPFGGIRGDAKELWRMIRSNREPRIRLLQVKTSIGQSNQTNSNNSSFGGVKQSIVDKLLEEAVVIVWSCGYSTNLIPIYDQFNQRINIKIRKGQVDVDEQARVLYDKDKEKNSTGIVDNLFGSGLGYGLSATLDNGEYDGSSGRADGVAVYLKRSATLVLAHVIGNRVFGGMGIRSWEERNILLRKQHFMTNACKVEKLFDETTSDTPTTPIGSPKKTLESPKKVNSPAKISSNSLESTQKSLRPTTNASQRLSVSSTSNSIEKRPLSAGRASQSTSTPTRKSFEAQPTKPIAKPIPFPLQKKELSINPPLHKSLDSKDAKAYLEIKKNSANSSSTMVSKPLPSSAPNTPSRALSKPLVSTKTSQLTSHNKVPTTKSSSGGIKHTS